MKNIGLYIDHIGFLIWLFVFIVSIIDLKNKKIKRKWPRWILFFIGLLGVIIDGALLISFYSNFDVIKSALFFDYFGIPVFTYMIGISIYDIKHKIKYKLLRWIYLLISVFGLFIDGGMIFGILRVLTS